MYQASIAGALISNLITPCYQQARDAGREDPFFGAIKTSGQQASELTMGEGKVVREEG